MSSYKPFSEEESQALRVQVQRFLRKLPAAQRSSNFDKDLPLLEEVIRSIQGMAKAAAPPGEEEDVAQDAYLKFLTSYQRNGIRPGGMKTLARKIIRSVITDSHRKRQFAVSDEESGDPVDPRIRPPQNLLLLREELELAMRHLSPQVQEVVRLKVLGYTYQEIADLLELPVSTVRGRLNSRQLRGLRAANQAAAGA
jgi:RNA polymerase sigma-70 factor (ECF subfamily)